MSDPFRYKPFTLPLKPFSIGLSAIDPKQWIEPDGDLLSYLDEKNRLLETNRDDIFREVEGSREAQAEARDLLVEHLTGEHPELYRREDETIRFLDRSVALHEPDVAPLLTAGSIVADDLVVLEKKPDGWNVTAGYVAFPSGWSLKEKAGLPMEGVHAHVPGFEGGTRNAMMINRIFDNLQPDLPAARLNWSIYPEGELFWPPERGARADRGDFNPANNFIRVERQTLRRLPKTGAILFTIRIYQDPLTLLAGQPDRRDLALALAAKLEEFTPEQLRYKGMVKKKDKLVEYLRG
ncbi:heme-dependent oxidative N-demethylase family protein [Rhizobium alvei]|uniref:DUF3445 domain-containing protein n=1 Tax=Rhizobium alvei TaxID=1132659 RepID=A0ABT8YP36_9HYPH|nr:DUF3445 domain-containing protein [Rhizobium alvei]MDO6965286.1 DUF3445 domain-containing protein [Rhizobium alvei]